MIAAIYARKSTEQHGVALDAKSVTRQKELARKFAMSRGWTIDDSYVYEDDGISGAEFRRRPGLMQLMGALHPSSPFEVLVVSEQKSLGRESFETNFTIKQLAEAGVEIFEYVQGKSLTPKNWLDKAMSAMRSAADEAHREQTSERVHEAHLTKAQKGYVVGGRVFGYRNKDVANGVDHSGRPARSHVVRVISEPEAAVVRRIFALYDAGYGLKRIAKLLTVEGAARPTPFRRTDGLLPVGAWVPSTVRAVLNRELYHGEMVWNKTRKKNGWGKLDVQDRPESEWVRSKVEDLRIVDEDLWQRVVTRRKEVEHRAVRFESGRLSGRPPKHAIKNLLAGLATCGVCGGGLVVELSGVTRRAQGRRAFYICHRRRHHGTACMNALRVPVSDMNDAVLQAIETHALTPEAVEQVIALTERDDVRDQQDAVRRERTDLEKRISRLVAAVETGGHVPSLVAKVRELEARRTTLDRDLKMLRPVPRLAPAVIEDRLAEWRRLLRQSTTQGRTVLQRVLKGRIVFTPTDDGTGYTFEAPTQFEKLFTGLVVERPAWVDPSDKRGTEHIGPEDTFDADYGRLLEQATVKGWRALQDSNLRPPGS